MKLLLCKYCGDIFNMSNVIKGCKCGKSSGRYMLDNLTVEVMGECVVICIHNGDLEDAIADERANSIRCWRLREGDERMRRLR